MSAEAAWNQLYADINNGQRGRADVIRLIEEHRPGIHAGTLDGAWDQAQVALPSGWCDLMVYHFDAEPEGHHEPSQYGAKSLDPATGAAIYATGPTPAAALLALAAALRATFGDATFSAEPPETET